jgi:hypothetical protein
MHLSSLSIALRQATGGGLFARAALDMQMATGALDPRITFTRASGATRFNSMGLLEVVGADVYRRDYDPVVMTEPGKGARTNVIRNNTMRGAVVGVVGSGGALPTNWIIFDIYSGGSLAVVATGKENGIDYIDLRISGTATADKEYSLRFDGSTQVPAIPGQTWSSSAYWSIVGGSISNLPQLTQRIVLRTSSGSYLADVQTSLLGITSTQERITTTTTLSNASTAFIQPFIGLRAIAGVTYDFTIRIGMPQLELGSVATEVIPTTTEEGVRFDNPLPTRAPRGRLIEGARTNLALQSEAFNDVYWLKSNLLLATDSATAPSGLNTAEKITAVADANPHNISRQFPGLTSGAVHTFSIFAKRGEHSFIRVVFSATIAGQLAAANFNLDTGVVTNTAGVTGSAQSVGNGWYKCSISFTQGAEPVSVSFGPALTSTGSTAFMGDGVSGIYLWGAQLEVGASASTYIPTTSSQVTRAADIPLMSGVNFTDWYNQTEGTFFVEGSFGFVPTAAQYPGLLAVGDGNSANSHQIYMTATNALTLETRVGGVTQALLQRVNTSPSLTKVAATYKPDDYSLVLNGGTAATDVSAAVPTVDRLSIGTSATSQNHLFGHIRRLAYWSTPLTIAEQQQLTQP